MTLSINTKDDEDAKEKKKIKKSSRKERIASKLPGSIASRLLGKKTADKSTADKGDTKSTTAVEKSSAFSGMLSFGWTRAKSFENGKPRSRANAEIKSA